MIELLCDKTFGKRIETSHNNSCRLLFLLLSLRLRAGRAGYAYRSRSLAAGTIPTCRPSVSVDAMSDARVDDEGMRIGEPETAAVGVPGVVASMRYALSEMGRPGRCGPCCG